MDYSYYGFAVGEEWPMPSASICSAYNERNSTQMYRQARLALQPLNDVRRSTLVQPSHNTNRQPDLREESLADAETLDGRDKGRRYTGLYRDVEHGICLWTYSALGLRLTTYSSQEQLAVQVVAIRRRSRRAGQGSVKSRQSSLKSLHTD